MEIYKAPEDSLVNEPIAFIKGPIDPKDIKDIQGALQTHGAMVTKFRTHVDDCWYLILLPEGTTNNREKMQVAFPDGYAFLFYPGRMSTKGTFITPPMIALLPESVKEMETSL